MSGTRDHHLSRLDPAGIAGVRERFGRCGDSHQPRWSYGDRDRQDEERHEGRREQESSRCGRRTAQRAHGEQPAGKNHRRFRNHGGVTHNGLSFLSSAIDFLGEAVQFLIRPSLVPQQCGEEILAAAAKEHAEVLLEGRSSRAARGSRRRVDVAT